MNAEELYHYLRSYGPEARRNLKIRAVVYVGDKVYAGEVDRTSTMNPDGNISFVADKGAHVE